jgi:glycosyltransferase involved in cell wall biosynthesis
MGFDGESVGVFPAFGGVAWEDIKGLRQEGTISSRRTILLKGRHLDDRVGRAMTAMDALERCQDLLTGYRIAISQASPAVAKKANTLNSTTALNIQVLPHLRYDNLLRIVGQSRAMLALTVNDGLPSILVEAMSLGAFPIHSDLEPIREWIRDGENGLLVPAEDPQAVAHALRRALKDDGLVDRAAKINARLVRDRLSEAVVRPRVIEMYEHVAEQGRVPH